MKKIKYSISTYVTAVFILLLAAIVFFLILANGTFLQRYYQNNKTDGLIECYENMNGLFSGGNVDLETESFDLEFDRIAADENVSVLVVNSAFETLRTTGDEGDRLHGRLMSYIFKDDPNYLFKGRPAVVSSDEVEDRPSYGPGRRFQEDVIIETGSGYEIRRSIDPRMGEEYLELMGTLDGGFFILIRTGVVGIRSNVRVFSRFLLYVAIIALFLGAILIAVVTRRITKPVLELARLSDRMTNLDFDARYTGDANNEIGYLGSRMNRMSDTLQKTISELKNANNELKVDLEKREQLDEMRSDFISNVSHELKTPIALIQGYAEGLKDAVNDDEESRDYYCDVIIDEAAKMNRMVKSLLTLNQLEFGGEKMNLERIDVAQMIRNYVAAAQILIENSGVKVALSVPESLMVWGDEYKVEEVIMNYFTNAVNYSGGEKQIKITAKRTGENVRIGVFNTGDPIPEELFEKLWTKFYKVDKARTRQVGGSGVGLAIVKAIMEAHHMPYGARNVKDGVEFWFELEAAGAGYEDE